MTIEFRCPHCQKLLKTADDKAGVRANCPGCGQSVTVPELAAEAAEVDSPWHLEQRPTPAARKSPDPDDVGDAAEEEEVADTKSCPMCGAEIKREAIRCRFCGENLAEQTERGHAEIDAGDILTTAWAIYKDRFGIVFGASLIILGINFGLNMLSNFVQFLMDLPNVARGGAGGGGGGGAFGGIDALQIAVAFAFSLVGIAINVYLEAGYRLLLLKVLRGEQVEVSEVFSGGRFFWRSLGATILFGLLLIAGFICLIAPYFFVLLVLWPFAWVLVDRDCGVIDSFRYAHEATTGNYLACIVLALAALGVSIAGVLACCIGIIFTNPFVWLFFGAAYCGMTGQLSMRRAR